MLSFLDRIPVDKKVDNNFFTNKIEIDEFSQKIIKDLAFFRNSLAYLKKISILSPELAELEKEAFNLLVTNIELKKGSSKVEVGVIGGFSSGKSTFINSLFKKDICPMKVSPTTSSITKFYYGHKEKITLNNKEIAQYEYYNLSQHSKGDIKRTKAHYIEYAYPFDTFNSIILYDTPGFANEQNEGDTKATMDTLKNIDVVFFVVDILKGDIDSTSIDRIKNLKGKKLYCILNKSDLKTKEAIGKIKKAIIEKKIFEEVLEYSASKVLEEGKKDIFRNSIKELEEKFIFEQKEFQSTNKGVLAKKEGRRRRAKTEYKITIGRREFIVDNFYQIAQNQRDKVERLLNNLSDSKRDIVKKNFNKSNYDYRLKSKAVVEKLSKEVSRAYLNKNHQFEDFDEDIMTFKREFEKFEEANIKSFYKELVVKYRMSHTISDVSDEEKSFWSVPYAKIHFSINEFDNHSRNIEFFDLLNQFLLNWQKYFNEKYGFYLIIPRIDLLRNKIINEVKESFSKYLNGGSYIKYSDAEDGIYFEDKKEAREFLNETFTEEFIFITSSYDNFFENNQEKIEAFKRELYTEDTQSSAQIEELKIELQKFLKENNYA